MLVLLSPISPCIQQQFYAVVRNAILKQGIYKTHGLALILCICLQNLIQSISLQAILKLEA